jgi:hypothetical protein
MAAQVANQRAVFFKHQKRDQDAGHGEHDYEHADAEVQFAGARLAAAVEHAGDEEAQKAAEGSSGEGLPASLDELFHFVVRRLLTRRRRRRRFRSQSS